MIKLALIGKGISHSRSQQIYQDLLGREIDYRLLDFETADEIKSLEGIFSDGLNGISITYPYKQHFLNEVYFVDSKVVQLGAINCIRRTKEGFEATNTDFLAAGYLLRNQYSHFNSFLVLGSGNMARVIEAQLIAMNKTFKRVSRRTDGDLNQIDYIEILRNNVESTLIVNCCSREFEFSAKLPPATFFWDMNYNIVEHEKLKSRGVNYMNGLNLLKWQAKYALNFWDISQIENS